MEQITIHIRDRRKARALRDFLKSLDYVEKVTIADLRNRSAARGNQVDFFASAGIWSGRKVTVESLRQKAWPRRT
jgi:hypothetical protein